MLSLRKVDPEIARVIVEEEKRQTGRLELIASENFASSAVREAQGSVLTNKYAEGYPGKRYYGGCEHVDVAEKLAQERARELFGAEYANVQPHSGSQANMAVFFSVLQPGDTILGMDLRQGGHLTHGSPVSFSGRLFHVVSYGVRRDTEEIDYDQVEAVAGEHRPKLIIAGASAYPRIIDFERFRHIAKKISAYLMVDMAHIAGLVGAGVHPNPVPHADFVTSTTHKTLRGPRGGLILPMVFTAKCLTVKSFPEFRAARSCTWLRQRRLLSKRPSSPRSKNTRIGLLANSKRLAEELSNLGYRLVSGGTDTHLMLIDLTPRQLTGKRCRTNAGHGGNYGKQEYDTV